MPYRKPELINDEIYHIFNRGVEKRNIFEDYSDYYRFIFGLYECNNSNSVRVSCRINDRRAGALQNVQGDTLHTVTDGYKAREVLVEILAFCLMPNHYHLIVRQLADNGITLFMKKLGNSYVGYFNERHKRKGLGSLFQGPFKAVYVAGNNQFLNLASYVFVNPVGILEPNWKESGIVDPKGAINFLGTYRWSSYLDSIGIKNFPSVSNRNLLMDLFSEESPEDGKREGDAYKIYDNIKKNVESWVLYKSNLEKGLQSITDPFL